MTLTYIFTAGQWPISVSQPHHTVLTRLNGARGRHRWAEFTHSVSGKPVHVNPDQVAAVEVVEY